MANRDEESVKLDEAAARRLLERATELDARLAGESSVAELRDAARAAGISEEAFDRALTEVRYNPAPTPLVPAPPTRRYAVAFVVMLALLLAAAVLVSRTAAFRGPGEPEAARAAEALPTPVPGARAAPARPR